MNTFPWLIRREFWENRSFVIVPGALAALFIVFYLYGVASHSVSDFGGDSIAGLIQTYPERAKLMFGAGTPLLAPAVLLYLALLLTWLFYLCYTLYSDRKDRSVLFWKSLPVTDAATVLSKLAIAMLFLPAVTLVATLSTAAVITLINAAAVALSGNSPWEYVLSQVPYVSGPIVLVYFLLVQALWYAPVFGWLLLVSAWAPRVPPLWAILPPLALFIIERMLLNTELVGQFLKARLTGWVSVAFRDSDLPDSIESGHWREELSSVIDPASFLAEPGLYFGLVLAAVFVAAAIWSRRYRDAS